MKLIYNREFPLSDKSGGCFYLGEDGLIYIVNLGKAFKTQDFITIDVKKDLPLMNAIAAQAYYEDHVGDGEEE